MNPRQDVLSFDLVEHAVAHHADVLGFIDQELDRNRVSASNAMNLLPTKLSHFIGRIVSIDAIVRPFSLTGDVIAGWTRRFSEAAHTGPRETTAMTDAMGLKDQAAAVWH